MDIDDSDDIDDDLTWISNSEGFHPDLAKDQQ